MINKISNYWRIIKPAPINFILALLFTFILIKPMFQVNIISGIFYIVTFLWIFIKKPELFIKYPGYSFIIFFILLIRWGIGSVSAKGLDFLGSREVVSGIIYLIVWIMIYLKVKSMQKH